jgi:hypothetical protein
MNAKRADIFNPSEAVLSFLERTEVLNARLNEILAHGR